MVSQPGKNNLLTNDQRNLLESAQIGHLATSDTDGNPRIIPICFVEFSGNIYSVIDEKPKINNINKLKRVQNILVNSSVSFLVDHYDNDWRYIWYLQINGEASLIQKPASLMHYKLIDKYLPYSDMDIINQPLIRIIPETINLWGNTK